MIFHQRHALGVVAPGGGRAVAPQRHGDGKLRRKKRHVGDIRVYDRNVSVGVLAMLEEFKMEDLSFWFDKSWRLEGPVLVSRAKDVDRAQDHAAVMMDGFRRETRVAIGKRDPEIYVQ